MVAIEIAAGLVALYVVLLLWPPLGRRWLRAWHGTGDVHQYEFFRCQGCRRLVTFHHISTGGCACRESSKVSPAALRWGDKTRLLYLPWMVTSPWVRREALRRAALISERA